MRDLFNVKRGKRLIVKNRIKGKRIFITAGFENYGISGYIKNKEQEIFPKDTITIDMFGNTFFRNYEFSADDNILVLLDKDSINAKIKPFIVSAISKAIFGKYNYGKQYRLNSFNKTEIQLPTKNGKIDFDFMENFIKELEKEKIKQVDNYLEKNGLKSYKLTSEEEKVLEDFKGEKFEWGKYKIGGDDGLFDVKTVKGFDEGKLNLSKIKKSNFIEFIGRTRSNNGIKGYLEKIEIEPNIENIISVSQIGTIVAQIRNNKWYASQNIFALYPKESYKKLISLYIIGAINKALSGTFSEGYSNYPTLDKLKNLNVQLPTKDNQPDYKLMETLISAVEKKVIKNVVEYIKKKI